MTLQERIEFLQTYLDEFTDGKKYGYGYYPTDYLESCKELQALGFEWGDKIINDNKFCIRKNGHLTNRTTKYEFDDNTYYIHWDNGIGKLMFVSSTKYYSLIDDEYNEFLEKLRSYGALDWDYWNDHMIFTVEDGKRLYKDYSKIREETAKKIKRKIKQEEVRAAKEEYEKLLAECHDEEGGTI